MGHSTMVASLSVSLLFLFILSSLLGSSDETLTDETNDITANITSEDRSGKVLSVFTVVKFPNTVCASTTSGRNGTCYTQSECTSKGGTASGTCASSLGVCCIFEVSCGNPTLAENNTYFTSTDITKGSNCRMTVCKCSTDVCQLRLDFETFVLNVPITKVSAEDSTGNSQANTGNAGTFTQGGTCHVDTFGVSSPGSTTIPTICGTNTGEHMYVPASDQCNVLSANIGSTSTSTTGSFSIKITQIPCDSPVLPPRGCLQYHYGSPSGTVASYNFAGSSGVATAGTSQLLANQHYTNCIRTERTYCSICYWSATIATGFHMSVPNGIAAIGLLGFDTNCGALGTGTGAAIDGVAYANGGTYDFIQIPSGVCHPPSPAIASTGQPVDRYCGSAFNCRKNTNAIAGTPDATVCTSLKPFKIGVHSDGVEWAHPIATSEAGPNTAATAGANNYGFSLNYYMKTNCLYYKLAGE